MFDMACACQWKRRWALKRRLLRVSSPNYQWAVEYKLSTPVSCKVLHDCVVSLEKAFSMGNITWWGSEALTIDSYTVLLETKPDTNGRFWRRQALGGSSKAAILAVLFCVTQVIGEYVVRPSRYFSTMCLFCWISYPLSSHAPLWLLSEWWVLYRFLLFKWPHAKIKEGADSPLSSEKLSQWGHVSKNALTKYVYLNSLGTCASLNSRTSVFIRKIAFENI